MPWWRASLITHHTTHARRRPCVAEMPIRKSIGSRGQRCCNGFFWLALSAPCRTQVCGRIAARTYVARRITHTQDPCRWHTAVGSRGCQHLFSHGCLQLILPALHGSFAGAASNGTGTSRKPHHRGLCVFLHGERRASSALENQFQQRMAMSPLFTISASLHFCSFQMLCLVPNEQKDLPDL